MISLAIRVASKLMTLVCYFKTLWHYPGFFRDPTKILIEEYTPLQHKAATTVEVKQKIAAARLALFIPFRDSWMITQRCLDSLASQEFSSLDVLICLIDNGSKESTTAAGIAAYVKASVHEVRVLRYDEPFNFSKLNNNAVSEVADFSPEWLLFLNNDIELIAKDSISRMVAMAQNTPGCGAVGCTLRYPDMRIQHLFVAPGVKIVAAHPLKGFHLSDNCAWFRAPRPVAAVTGAALLVSRGHFNAVSGFDESLATLGQDVDLCLKLQDSGLTNWVLSDVSMLHHESASRRGQKMAATEIRTMYEKWEDKLTMNQYFSIKFTTWSETPLLRVGKRSYPWRRMI